MKKCRASERRRSDPHSCEHVHAVGLEKRHNQDPPAAIAVGFGRQTGATCDRKEEFLTLKHTISHPENLTVYHQDYMKHYETYCRFGDPFLNPTHLPRNGILGEG